MTTVVFALLALFVLFKLRTVLGARTGTEKRLTDIFSRSGRTNESAKAAEESSNVIQLPGSPSVKQDQSVRRWEALAEQRSWEGLDSIGDADPSFAAQSFLDGAKAAYEMIVGAFAAGDKQSLRNLLGNEVYDGFAAAISAREARGEKVETTFVSIESAKITDAVFRNGTAQITVRFLSKLITATRDRNNVVIDGNAGKVVDITDVWTFLRDATSRDPNWKLIATETAH